jgi:hypothetical protein
MWSSKVNLAIQGDEKDVTAAHILTILCRYWGHFSMVSFGKHFSLWLTVKASKVQDAQNLTFRRSRTELHVFLYCFCIPETEFNPAHWAGIWLHRSRMCHQKGTCVKKEAIQLFPDVKSTSRRRSNELWTCALFEIFLRSRSTFNQMRFDVWLRPGRNTDC